MAMPMAPRVHAVTACLLFLVMVFSGCTAFEPREGEGDQASPGDGTTAPGTGTGTDGDTTTDDDAGTEDDTETESPTPPPPADDPAPPGDREEDSPEDVDRPGEYALLPYRADRDEDARLEVPTWGAGWSWTWSLWHVGQESIPGCGLPTSQRPGYTHAYAGTGQAEGIDVYTLEETGFDCAGETTRETTANASRDHLLQVDPSGMVEWHWIFPFEDGKRWLYQNSRGHNITVEMTWLEAYEHDGETVKAWRAVSTDTESDSNTTNTFWFGEAARNMLLREIRTDDWCPAQENDDGSCPVEREDDYLLAEFRLESYEAGS